MKEVLDNEEKTKKYNDKVVEQALAFSKPEGQAKLKAATEQTAAIKALDKAGIPVTQENSTGITKFSPKNEAAFAAWKEKYAKNSTSTDKELRELFKAGKKPNKE
jgi:hypothetical protein